MGAQLDTSGRVAGDIDGLAVWYEFEDLSPSAQGYVEALFASAWADEDELIADLIGAFDGPAGMFDERDERGPQFTDLSPEALTMILRICGPDAEGYVGPTSATMGYANNVEDGARFWKDQQAGVWASYRPLRVFLNDAGKVCLEAAQ
jgi:hypothetical protein